MASNGFSKVASEVEERLASDGINGVTEKDLLVLLYEATRKPRPLVDWSPKQVAAAALAILPALGLVTMAAAKEAIALLGGV